jgi:hypothetical protein
VFRSNVRSVFSGLNLVANAARMPRVARLMQAPGLLFILQWVSQKIQRSCLRLLSKSLDETISSERGSISTSPKNDEHPVQRLSRPSSTGELRSHPGSNVSNKSALSQEKVHQMKKFLSKRNSEDRLTNVTHSKVTPNAHRQSQFGLNRYAFDYAGGNFRDSKISSLQRSQVGQTMFELTVRRVALALMVRIIQILYVVHSLCRHEITHTLSYI